MDHKYPVIAAKAGVKVGVVSAVMWALLDYASQNEPRGSIDGFDVEIYAVYSGFSEDEVNSIIRVMGEKDIITNGSLVNWEKRQPKREDNSSDRVTKYREMKRNVTQCNAPEKIREDKDKDKEEDKDKDVDSEIHDNFTPDTAYKPLEEAYVKATGTTIPIGGGTATKKWVDAFVKLNAIPGVSPGDIAEALAILAEKDYQVVGPSSILNTVQGIITKRNVKKNGEKPKDFKSGEYAEWIN